MMQKTLTVQGVATGLGCSLRTVRNAIKCGTLRAVKRGGQFDIKEVDLINWLGHERANDFFRNPVAYFLASHSKSGVPYATWDSMLQAEMLFYSVNSSYWGATLKSANLGDPADWSREVKMFLDVAKTKKGAGLNSDVVFKAFPRVLQNILTAARV